MPPKDPLVVHSLSSGSVRPESARQAHIGFTFEAAHDAHADLSERLARAQREAAALDAECNAAARREAELRRALSTGSAEHASLEAKLAESDAEREGLSRTIETLKAQLRAQWAALQEATRLIDAYACCDEPAGSSPLWRPELEAVRPRHEGASAAPRREGDEDGRKRAELTDARGDADGDARVREWCRRAMLELADGAPIRTRP